MILHREASRGWFFQSFAPLETLYKMRSAAQYSRDETEFALLQQTLAARCVTLDRVSFPYEIADDPTRPAPPLSWHLTPIDISRIQNTWNAYKNDKQAISRVISFLQSSQNPATPQDAK